MKQYLDLLRNTLDNGVIKPSGRMGMPNVKGITHGTMTIDLREGFPLLTTKKMFYKGIIHELLWYMHGKTNIEYLVLNGCNFWTLNAYRHYCKLLAKETTDTPLTIAEFEHAIIMGDTSTVIPDYTLGDLGPVYGKQWRNKDGIDQFRLIYESLKSNPYERYKLMDLWNPKEQPQMALPPCLVLYQFLTEPYSNGIYLDLNMYQRSADLFLGLPFDIASMSVLLEIMAKATGYTARYAFWIGGHCDIYVDHLPVVREQLTRLPGKLPKINIKRELNNFYDILKLTIDDFEIIDYSPQEKLSGKLFA